MSHRARRVSDTVRAYDQMLFAKEEIVNGKSIISIFRKCKEWRKEALSYGVYVDVLFENPYRVMSLTDTWGIRGNKVDWGLIPIVERLRALDLWNSGPGIQEMFAQHEKEKKSSERKKRNDIESFLYDFHSSFAEATKDINTSNMNKIDKRRIGDKSLWHW